ncbi:MAG: dTDP-4-dehydrorhamnose 3,5-epimerase family protein [Patescibacteria group bacterium]
MIYGVILKDLVAHHDDRGFFCEVLKEGSGKFFSIKQVSIGCAFPGVIKAFHMHKRKGECFHVISGFAKVVLHDLRVNSETRGMTDVIYLNSECHRIVYIPPGVAHGYQALGNTNLCMLYATDEPYDPKDPDETKIPFDDSSIDFDWSIKNR